MTQIIRKQRTHDAAPTWTSLVLAALVKADDFTSFAQLYQAVPGINKNQLIAALIHLRKRHAIDSMEGGGTLWWFATPAEDDRLQIVEARVPEEPGTRNRKRGYTRKPKVQA